MKMADTDAGSAILSDARVSVNIDRISYYSFVRHRWGKFAEPHACSLPAHMKESRILTEVVDSGLCIDSRRWIQERFMISEKHPHTKVVFRSINEIRQQEVKHLLNYRQMIHPFSMFNLYYEFFMAFVNLIFLGLTLPKDIQHIRFVNRIKWEKFGFDMVMTTYIFMRFYIGYWDKEKMYVHLSQRIVARHYLKTYFIWDVLSCMPSYLIFLYAFNIQKTHWKLLKWLSILRMVRMRSIDHALCLVREYWGIPIEVYVAVQIALYTYLIMLCCMSLKAFLVHYPMLLENVSEREDYETSRAIVFGTIKTVLGAGKLRVYYSYSTAVCTAILAMVALFLQFWIMSKLYTLWQSFFALSEAGEDHQQQLTGYVKFKGLPPHIRQEIFCYFDFAFQKQFFDENTITNLLTDNLKKEIPNYRMDDAIDKIKFVRLLPNPVIMALVNRMESVYYCPGDKIFSVNKRSKNLYFIQAGTVALHDENNVEVCHLEDGSYYGDISVVIPQTHSVTMTALSPCKVLVLRGSVLSQILDQMPDLKETVLEFTRNLHMNRKNDWITQVFKTYRSVTALDNIHQFSSRTRKSIPSLY